MLSFYDLLPRMRGDLFNRAPSKKDILHSRERKKRETFEQVIMFEDRGGIGIEEGRAILMLPMLASFAYNVGG